MNLSNVQYINNNSNVDVRSCKRMNNLYEKYKNDFATYLIKHKHTLRLLLNNSTLHNIKAYEYTQCDHCCYMLTPLPYKSMRKFNNERDKKEFKRIERNAVMMRRIEYTHKIKENKLKKKYINNVIHVVYIQKIVRGYFMRKVMECVYMIKLQIQRFILHVKCYAVISRCKERKRSDSKSKWSCCGLKGSGNVLFEKKVKDIMSGSKGKGCVQRLNKSYNCYKKKKENVNESMKRNNEKVSNSNSNSNVVSCKCYSVYTSPNRVHKGRRKINNNQSRSNYSLMMMMMDKTKSPDKQSVYINTNCNCNSNSNKEGIILFQNMSIVNKDGDDNGNDNINIIPSPRSQNSNEENDIHNNVSKLPSLNVNNTNLSNNTTKINHSLNHSNINNNNDNKDNDIKPQPNTNAITNSNSNSNQISIEHSNKIKLIQTAYRNYIFHKNNKHTFKYSSNIFNFSVNNPSVEALNNNPKEKPSSQAIIDSPDINLKDETYLNDVQFYSNNNNNNTTIENTETIPDNYELTQQRANKLFPLFTSITNDISLLYRINKITQTQHNHNHNVQPASSLSSLSSSHEIIENDNEVFN